MRRAPLLAAGLACVTVLAAFAAGVLPAFAGTGGANQPVLPVEMSVTAARALADDRAQAWHPEAYLVKAFANEGPHRSAVEDPPFLYDTSGDPRVGNGLAPVWTLGYAAPDTEGVLYFVAVRHDGRIDYAGELPDPEGCCMVAISEGEAPAHEPVHGPPRLDFRIDAAEAFEAVADYPEFRNFSREHPVHMASMRLAAWRDGNATWLVGFQTATHFSASAAVDATNGTVLHVSAWPRAYRPYDPPTPPAPPRRSDAPEDYHAEHAETLGMDRSRFEVNVPVDAPEYARELRVTALLDGALHGETFTLRLLDDDGNELARASLTDAANVTFTQFEGWGRLYRVSIEPDRVLLHDVEARVTVEVDYGEEARELEPATGPFVFNSRTYPLQSEEWFDVDTHGRPVERVVATLTWNRTVPTQNLELVLLDTYGNPVARARGEPTGTGVSTIKVEATDLGDGCCPIAVVRTEAPSLLGVPFTLVVEPELGPEAWRW